MAGHTPMARDALDAWTSRHPRLIGCNYVTSSAVNSLEMWNAGSFDPETIAREFSWAHALGLNCVRVFLHHLLWEDDRTGFLSRLDRVLDLAAQRGLSVLPVLFDSCFEPDPVCGPQQPARPGVMCSRWVQCPGRRRLEDESRWPELEDYAHDVVARFAGDDRVLAWDVWNEPPAESGQVFALGDLGARESARKTELTYRLLAHVFEALAPIAPRQPLTSAVWWTRDGAWLDSVLTAMERLQIEHSDVVSFHSYSAPAEFRAQADSLLSRGRPVLCTEFMDRAVGATLEALLPIAAARGLAMLMWGCVEGQIQARHSIASWASSEGDPELWHHDLLRADGTPYAPSDVDAIRSYLNAGL